MNFEAYVLLRVIFPTEIVLRINKHYRRIKSTDNIVRASVHRYENTIKVDNTYYRYWECYCGVLCHSTIRGTIEKSVHPGDCRYVDWGRNAFNDDSLQWDGCSWTWEEWAERLPYMGENEDEI
ncbi:hypothetical protein BNJ_00286 [Kaumoebavirus]|uniref:hypothetical protein n=1 Tax=Kaumoebavirus TaxID=1859492 RepID=UPI0009C1CBB4|nr:hypothetical protein BNJ_00286 [Kaumoebavirus]ARA72109.1 hypothetical protein BNJ_00286 [Kaumoebavirus]